MARTPDGSETRVRPLRTTGILYSGLAGICALLSMGGWADGWLLVTCGLSLMGGLFGLRNLLEEPVARINFLLVSAVVITLASASGVLVGCAVCAGIAPDFWVVILGRVPVTPADLALAQVYTNVFAACLWWLGGRLHRSGLVHRIYMDVRVCLHTYKPAVFLLMGILMACQLYLLNRRVVVYGGNDLIHEGEPTHPLLALVAPLAPVLPFVLAYYTRVGFRDRRWLTGMLLLGLLAAELGWFFLFGRRSVVYFFVMLAAGLTHERVLTVRMIRKQLLPVGLAVLLMLTIADTYHKLRTYYGFDQLQQMSVVDGLRGLQTMDTEQYAGLRTLNVALRSVYSSLALGQFMNLFSTTAHKPLAGQVLINSLKLATPSDFIIDKKSILAKEALYESIYALSLTDISETLYLESFIDFGWYGCCLYPVLLFLLFYGLYGFTARYANPLFSLLASCVLVSLALSMVETDMITFLASLRNLGVYYIVTQLLGRASYWGRGVGIPATTTER